MKTLAWVWGSEPPAFSIGYDTPEGLADSGFTVLCDDAPDPEEVDATTGHPAISWVCLDCLIEDDPEVSRGLDLAREHGVADLAENGEWL
jgi:hypothetical protein